MNPLETRGKSRILLWGLLATALILYGFPFIYLLLTSFKTPLDAIAVPPTVWPEEWTLENYVAALSREGVVPALINSVVTAGISTVVYDRGGYVYHGRVKALIDATREAGLNKHEAAAEAKGDAKQEVNDNE